MYSTVHTVHNSQQKAMNEPEKWRKRVKDPDGDYEVDVVESFFSELNLH